jgi:hypothetical protein
MVGIYLILWIIIFLYVIIYINNESILIKDINDQYYLNIFIYIYI